MAFNRTRLIAFTLAKTVETMHGAVEELASVPVQPSIDGCNAEVDAWLDEIKAVEKTDFIAKAQASFAGLTEADAVKSARRLTRRSAEARLQAQWLIAKATGCEASKNEACRKAASMRTSLNEIETDLARLCAQAGLSMIACGTTEKGRLAKAKSSPAPIMALEALRNARKAVAELAALRAAHETKSKAG